MRAAGPSEEEVSAFQAATRDLVGIALRSLALLGGEVSLPQFRMLAVLAELGRCPSARVAHALHLGASSVTRMGDRLEASGHVVRGADPRNRSVVTLELSERGRELVAQVMSWRHAELTRILAGVDPAERAAAASGLRPGASSGDFTLTPRVLTITAVALPVGAASAVAAFCLLRLIGLITNLVFYQRVGTQLVSPGLHHHPFWLMLGAPVAGGLVVGLMARYGSEKIRGHGMPEAIEAIVTGGSRVAPRVAILKPVSAAISIGTGGPFGAEGPLQAAAGTAAPVRDFLEPRMIIVHSDDTLRHVCYVFAEHSITQAPVLKDGDPGQLLGVISLRDLLHARRYDLAEEYHRERHLGPRLARQEGQASSSSSLSRGRPGRRILRT